jgi:hypothetical protein
MGCHFTIGRIQGGALQLDPGMAVETRSAGGDQRNSADEARLHALASEQRVGRQRPADTGAIGQAEAPVHGDRDSDGFTPPAAWRSAPRRGVHDGEEFAKVPMPAESQTDREGRRQRGD